MLDVLVESPAVSKADEIVELVSKLRVDGLQTGLELVPALLLQLAGKTEAVLLAVRQMLLLLVVVVEHLALPLALPELLQLAHPTRVVHRAAQGQVLLNYPGIGARHSDPSGLLAKPPFGRDGVVEDLLLGPTLAVGVLVLAVPVLVEADAHLGCRW